MTIVEALIQLRDDIKTWVANNLEALNTKIDNKSEFSGSYNDLTDAPVVDDGSGSLYIADSAGNVVMQVDENGVTTTNVDTQTISINGQDASDIVTKVDTLADLVGSTPVTDQIDAALGEQILDYNDLTNRPDILDDGSDSFQITDAAGNIVMSVDENGVNSVDLSINGVSVEDMINVHADDTDIHITAEERETWNAKSDFGGSYNELTDAPNIVEDGSGELNFVDEAGNIVMSVGEEGIKATALSLNGEDVKGALDLKANSDDVDEKVGVVSEDLAEHAADSDLHLTDEDHLILENVSHIQDDGSGGLDIVDEAGNIIFEVNEAGAKTTLLDVKGIVMNGQSLDELIDAKADVDAVYSKEEADELFGGKADDGHDHDDRYYTETEMDTKLGDYAKTSDVMAVLDELEQTQSDLSGVQDTLQSHTDNTDIHVTADDQTILDNVSNILEDGTGTFTLVDEDGNIIMNVDETGVQMTNINADTIILGDRDLMETVDEKIGAIDASIANFIIGVGIDGKANKQVGEVLGALGTGLSVQLGRITEHQPTINGLTFSNVPILYSFDTIIDGGCRFTTTSGGKLLEAIMDVNSNVTFSEFDVEDAVSVSNIIKSYPVSEGHSIKAGDLVDIVDNKITGTIVKTIADYNEGDVIALAENGMLTEFYVAKHDYEADLNGTGRTLVVRKQPYNNAISFASDQYLAEYSNGPLDTWLNNDYFDVLDQNVRSNIGETTFKYMNNTGEKQYAAATLSRPVFTLSYVELKGSYHYSNISVAEGELLPISTKLMIDSYYDFWTRSPDVTCDTSLKWDEDGEWRNPACVFICGRDLDGVSQMLINRPTNTYCVIPAFTLPSSFEVKSIPASGQAIALNTGHSGETIDVIFSGTVSGNSELANFPTGTSIDGRKVCGHFYSNGVLTVFPHANELFETGQYLGNDNPVNYIQLGYKPNAVMIFEECGATSAYSNYTVTLGGLMYPECPIITEDTVYSDPYVAAEITDDGFNVYSYKTQSYDKDDNFDGWEDVISARANLKGHKYYYIAYR